MDTLEERESLKRDELSNPYRPLLEHLNHKTRSIISKVTKPGETILTFTALTATLAPIGIMALGKADLVHVTWGLVAGLALGTLSYEITRINNALTPPQP